MSRRSRTLTVRAAMEDFETPMQKLELTNTKLERDRSSLARENAKLKETLRKLRIEHDEQRRGQTRIEQERGKSQSKTQEMYVACAELAQTNRNLVAANEATDRKRREILRRHISDEKKERMMERSINMLNVEREQRKVTDRVRNIKAAEDEETIIGQRRRIVKLETENKGLKEKLIVVEKELSRVREALKVTEKSSAIERHKQFEEVKAGQELVNQTRLSLRKKEEEQARAQGKAAEMEQRCHELGSAQKHYIQDIHVCNDALRREKLVVASKEKEIRQLRTTVDGLEKRIKRQNEQNTGLESKMQQLMTGMYESANKRDVERRGSVRYDKLSAKYCDLREQSTMLSEENSFLVEHNKTLKAQLRSQGSIRVNELMKQVKMLTDENRAMKAALDEHEPDA